MAVAVNFHLGGAPIFPKNGAHHGWAPKKILHFETSQTAKLGFKFIHFHVKNIYISKGYYQTFSSFFLYIGKVITT